MTWLEQQGMISAAGQIECFPGKRGTWDRVPLFLSLINDRQAAPTVSLCWQVQQEVLYDAYMETDDT
jgi:hypothetical protein